MMPHLAEESWAALGHPNLVAEAAWPQADPALVLDETITVAIQVNGKRRGEIELPRDADEGTVRDLVLRQDRVVKLFEGKEIRKWVIVPNRIVNVVVG